MDFTLRGLCQCLGTAPSGVRSQVLFETGTGTIGGDGTFELAWKTLKDPLDALDQRNLLALTYSEESALLAEELIKRTHFPALKGIAL